MDFIIGNQAHGSVAAVLMENNFDARALRPYIGKNGRTYITTTNQNGEAVAVPLTNATATLRKDEWKLLDEAVVKAAQPRMKAVADLRSRGLVYNIPNGMGKTVLETETQSDITAATVSMDGLRQADNDRPLYELSNLPLPIIHKDFSYSARQVMTSRNGGSPLDTTTAELAARRVAEMAEQMLVGATTPGTYTYGGGTIYGYRNYTGALTKTITSPTASSWTAPTTVQEVLQMRAQAAAAYHFGPYVLYCSQSWDVYMDDDYSAVKGDMTLRNRLKMIENIEDVRTLDYLSDYDLVLVQMTSDVARMVIGMDVTTVQWETQGGMQLNYKVMAILVPQLRADQNSSTGIVYGSV